VTGKISKLGDNSDRIRAKLRPSSSESGQILPLLYARIQPTELNKKQEKIMRLRRNQVCPIHRSRSCCGREVVRQERPGRQIGVRRIDDPQHPRRYRELRSNGEMRKLLDRKIVAQNGKCGICEERFTDYSDNRAGSHQLARYGRRLAGRSPGQHSGCPLVVQRREGIEPRMSQEQRFRLPTGSIPEALHQRRCEMPKQGSESI